MKTKIAYVFTVILVGLAFIVCPTFAAEKKPNIVFILLDNVGWGDFSVYGGSTPTPRSDKLASEGIRFNTTPSSHSARRRAPRS